MPLSTDVNLPKSHVPRFPDKCVVCGCQSPANTVRLMTGSVGWWTWIFWWYGKPFVVKAPACRRCGWKLHAARWNALIVTLGLAFLIFWFLDPILAAHVPRALRKWALVGSAFLCLLPLFAFQVYFPQAFDITAYGDNVDYEFRNAWYALEFASLNTDAGKIKIISPG
jgi:hypothetical protein